MHPYHMTYRQAVKKANQLAQKTGKFYYVVNESVDGHGETNFDYCDDEDLDTFYYGAKVLYCTEDN